VKTQDVQRFAPWVRQRCAHFGINGS
jgi:hypothetical protein